MYDNKFGDYLYSRLPSIYRIKDQEVDYTLKRYLDALGVSFNDVEIDIKGILDLLDVEKMDSRFLPFYASMFGQTYEYDAPEEFQRKYLANIVAILKRKGTKEVIEFTARELTGMNARVREGHYNMFRTWGDSSHDEKCGEYTTPKTYGGSNKDTFYYVGGSRTDRFTVTVILSAEDKDSDEIFLNTQLLSRLVRNLVQPYINLIFKAYGIQDSEHYSPHVLEEHQDIYLDTYVHTSNIKYTEVSMFNDDNFYLVTTKPMDTMLDKVKLLPIEYDSHTLGEITSEDPLFNVTTIIHDIVESDITTDEYTDIEIEVTEDTFTTSNIKYVDISRFSSEDITTLNEVTEEDLGITRRGTVHVDEVFIRKTSVSLDSIHLGVTSDIITIDTVTEENSDTVISNYDCISHQYALSHEGIPNGIDSKYKLAPVINSRRPQDEWITENNNQITFGYWVTTYLEENKGEIDDSISIEVRSAKMWWYNESTKEWELKDFGFEDLGWRDEILEYNDERRSISGMSKLIGSTDSWGDREGYIIRHGTPTRGKASIIFGHQTDIQADNYRYYIAKVDCRLVKFSDSDYDNLDYAHLLLNISNTWRPRHDGMCEPNWETEELATLGKYIKVTRDWKQAFTTNLPQDWGGSIPTELQNIKEEE